MTTQPFRRTLAAFTQEIAGRAGTLHTEPTPAQRITALELLVQQLVFVLDARNGAFSTDELDAWLATCTNRMYATGSVPAGDVAALERLHGLVTA